VVSLDFSVTYSFRPYHGPGVDSAPSESEYREHFLGVKVPVHEADDLTTFMFQMSWKSGSLNLTGPVTGLLYLYLFNMNIKEVGLTENKCLTEVT